MQSKKEQKKLGREKLQRIIEMCMAIENHAVDPFMLDVDNILAIVKEYFLLHVQGQILQWLRIHVPF